jgi:hypothetical protein
MRFRRALDRGNVTAALSAASELQFVALAEALELTLLLAKRAEREEAWRERIIAAAVGFLQRLLVANGAYKETIHTLNAGQGASVLCQAAVSVRDQWDRA